MTRAIESGERAQSLDEVLWRSDGTSFPVQLAVSPMLDGRTVIGVVLTFTDLAEVRKTEAALQDAVQARDEVLAVVSHDLRNPVGTIGAAAELLLDIPVTERQRRDHLRIIRRSAERMGRLIQDLLDVARIESGSFALALERHDLLDVAREAVTEGTALARDAGVVLEGPDFDRTPVWADVDRHRVLQALSNLVGNAIRHSPAGADVSVDVERIGEEAWIHVTDRGPGIAPGDLGRVFDRFWKGHRAERKGAGLGLAIVRGIAEAHGGEVTVESEVGSGSRFSVRVPLSERPTPTPAGMSPDPS